MKALLIYLADRQRYLHVTAWEKGTSYTFLKNNILTFHVLYSNVVTLLTTYKRKKVPWRKVVDTLHIYPDIAVESRIFSQRRPIFHSDTKTAHATKTTPIQKLFVIIWIITVHDYFPDIFGNFREIQDFLSKLARALARAIYQILQ